MILGLAEICAYLQILRYSPQKEGYERLTFGSHMYYLATVKEDGFVHCGFGVKAQQREITLV